MITLQNKGISADILVGPDYGLTTKSAMAEKRPNTVTERESVIKYIKNISKSFPKTIFIPGTMFWYAKNPETKSYEAFISAPVYKNQHLMAEFFKERDVDEGYKATEFGKKIGKEISYRKGHSTDNFLSFQDKKIALEICADHGNQNVNGSDIELILAYDNKAGFYINPMNDSWSRHAIVCDGYSGTSTAQYFDSDKHDFKLLNSILDRDSSIDVFKL
jgi:hypothetical protein